MVCIPLQITPCIAWTFSWDKVPSLSCKECDLFDYLPCTMKELPQFWIDSCLLPRLKHLATSCVVCTHQERKLDRAAFLYKAWNSWTHPLCYMRIHCFVKNVSCKNLMWRVKLLITSPVMWGEDKIASVVLESSSVSRLGLAVRHLAGKRKDLGSIPLRLSFLFKKVVVCGHYLVTLFITSYWNIKMALIAAHLNAGIILMVTV